MVLRNSIIAILLVFTFQMVFIGEEVSSIDPFYKYEFFINKVPFSFTVNMRYIVDQTDDYSFFISDYDHFSFHPSFSVRDFSAIVGKSRALITRQETREDIVQWTIFEVPQKSELLINYRIVPADYFNLQYPLRSFFDGDKGLIFFETTLMKPVGYEDNSIEIMLNSRDIDIHRPFSIGTLRKDTFFATSIDEISSLIIPIGDWHKSENITEKSIINLFIDTDIPRSNLNVLSRDLRHFYSSDVFGDILSVFTSDMGIISQFLVFFHDEPEPNMIDLPVFYYNNYCFIFMPKIGNYTKDIQIILAREVIRQMINLYIARLDAKELSEYAPVNALISYLAVNSLKKAGILDSDFIERHNKMLFLKYPYNLKEYEYERIEIKEIASNIHYLPGLIDNKANMYYKLFYALERFGIQIGDYDSVLLFIEEYQRGISENKSILDILLKMFPEEADIIDQLYNKIDTFVKSGDT